CGDLNAGGIHHRRRYPAAEKKSDRIGCVAYDVRSGQSISLRPLRRRFQEILGLFPLPGVETKDGSSPRDRRFSEKALRYEPGERVARLLGGLVNRLLEEAPPRDPLVGVRGFRIAHEIPEDFFRRLEASRLSHLCGQEPGEARSKRGTNRSGLV